MTPRRWTPQAMRQLSRRLYEALANGASALASQQASAALQDRGAAGLA
jgi:hypothetical protein